MSLSVFLSGTGGGGGLLVAGRSAAEGACAYWGVESCCIALHVPGIDPVVRANWEQFVIPLSGVRFGRRGGGSPLDGLASGQLNISKKNWTPTEYALRISLRGTGPLLDILRISLREIKKFQGF